MLIHNNIKGEGGMFVIFVCLIIVIFLANKETFIYIYIYIYIERERERERERGYEVWVGLEALTY